MSTITYNKRVSQPFNYAVVHGYQKRDRYPPPGASIMQLAESVLGTFLSLRYEKKVPLFVPRYGMKGKACISRVGQARKQYNN